MRHLMRKLYLSISLSLLMILTVATTTYAWVGLLSNSSTDWFDIRLESVNLSDYGIELSLTGEEGSFTNSIDPVELKKVILKNSGYAESQLNSKNQIEDAFNSLNLAQCTTLPDYATNTLSQFKTLKNEDTKQLFQFDLYFSFFSKYEEHIEKLDNAKIYFKENILSGTVKSNTLTNPFIYPEYENLLENGIASGTEIKEVKVDSASAYRVSFQKSQLMDKYQPLQSSEINYQDLKIYQQGSQLPTYDSTSGIYSFGGVLPNETNLAIHDWNSKFETISITNDVVEKRKNDIIFQEGMNFIDCTKASEKITPSKMLKVRVSVWVEGWDADCFIVIDRSPIELNLVFSIESDE